MKDQEQLYYVVRKLEEKAEGGMGDVEFHFSFLCINARGEQCIVNEDYIQYNRPGIAQGTASLKEKDLYSWKMIVLSSEEEHDHSAECRRLYQDHPDLLIKPPFAPKVNRC